LTCEIQPTQGTIEIGGQEINSRFSNIKKLMGYCPQQNILIESLTVLENLRYFAELKGIKKAQSLEMAYQVISNLGLATY
jgi:ABC-2 type transport system ATP-binding protein